MIPRVLLLIVGSPEHRRLFNDALLGTPHRLIFASNPEDGRQRFVEVKPDLVIADVAHALALHDLLASGDEVPVILYGPSAQTAEHRPESLGAAAYLSEIEPSALLSLIDRVRQTDDLGEPTQTIDSGDLVELTVESDDLSIDPILVRAAQAEEARHAPSSIDVANLQDWSAQSGEELSGRGSLLLEPIAPVRDSASGPLEESSPVRPVPESFLFASEAPTGGHSMANEESLERSDALIAELPMPQSSALDSLDESRLGQRLAKRIAELHRSLDTLDYYALLGVQKSAPPGHIRDAYFELSVQYHPERYRLLRSVELKAKVDAIYQRIDEAYVVLGDAAKRRIYDERLQSGVAPRAPTVERRRPGSDAIPLSNLPPDVFDLATTNERSRVLVERARRSYERADLNGARLFLALARAHEPNPGPFEAAIRIVTDAAR